MKHWGLQLISQYTPSRSNYLRKKANQVSYLSLNLTWNSKRVEPSPRPPPEGKWLSYPPPREDQDRRIEYWGRGSACKSTIAANECVQGEGGWWHCGVCFFFFCPIPHSSAVDGLEVAQPGWSSAGVIDSESRLVGILIRALQVIIPCNLLHVTSSVARINCAAAVQHASIRSWDQER